MTKYVLVSFPESQDFMDNPRFDECIFCTQIEGHDCPEDSYMVPEDLYNQVYKNPQPYKVLEDTVSLMVSDSYKDRFKAEYIQLKIRYDKLKNMVDKWNNGTLHFVPTCPLTLYVKQLKAMEEYMEVLKTRAELEDVVL